MIKKYILLFFYLAVAIYNVSAQRISHIEPPYWWSEMTNDTLQIMIHGEHIGQSEIQIDDSDIKIIKTEYPENANYIFLYLNLADAKKDFKIDFYKKNNSKLIESYNYQLKERRKNSKDRIGFSSEDVIYLLMPDRFANGNFENDNISRLKEKRNRKDMGGRHGGDIQGIIDHIPYLDDLGITTIWSTPLLEDDVPAYSYHGYAISDFYRIDDRYGSNNDYKKLATSLHHRDMKLIMDAVTNHCSIEHWWIEDLPYPDWIHVWDGFQRSNYRMSTQFDPYRSASDFKLCEQGWFDTTMPDLNQSNQHLIRYLSQNAIWWIEFADLDGLRVDTYSFNDQKGISYFTHRVMEEYPMFNIVGEVWMHSQAEIALWQKDNSISGDYNSGLPSVMDFTLHDAILKCFNENEGSWTDGMIRVYNNFANDYLYPNPENILVFGENHDTDRLWHVLKNDIQNYKLLMTLLMTTRGIPQIYYGTEIGLSGEKAVGDGDIRKDFPGGWTEDSHDGFGEHGRVGREKEIYDFTKTILNWRRDAKVIHHGKMMHFIPRDNVYVYFRYLDDKLVMVVLNNSSENRMINLTRFKEILNGKKAFINILEDKEIVFKKKLEIDAKSSMILEWNGL